MGKKYRSHDFSFVCVSGHRGNTGFHNEGVDIGVLELLCYEISSYDT